MSNISLNYAQIIDPLSFKSINLAKIYIGEYGTLPNPANAATWKQAYFVNSDGTRTAASQPIRTNAAGFAVDGSGNIKTIQVDGGYSLLVQDQLSVTKFSQACSAANSGAVLEFDTIAGFTGALDGSVCYFKGRDTVGDGGGGPLRFLKGSTATANGVTIYAVPGGRLVREGWSVFGVNVKWSGAKGDGVTDDATAIQLAYSYCNSAGVRLYFPAGTYRIASKISIPRAGAFGDGTYASQILVDIADATSETNAITFGISGNYTAARGGIEDVWIKIADYSKATTMLYIDTPNHTSFMRNAKIETGTGYCVKAKEFFTFYFDDVVFIGKYTATPGPSNTLEGIAFSNVGATEINNVLFNKCTFTFLRKPLESTSTYLQGSNAIKFNQCLFESIGENIGNIEGYQANFDCCYFEGLNKNQNAALTYSVMKGGANNIVFNQCLLNFGTVSTTLPLFDMQIGSVLFNDNTSLSLPSGFTGTVIDKKTYGVRGQLIDNWSRYPVENAFLAVPSQWCGGYASNERPASPSFKAYSVARFEYEFNGLTTNGSFAINEFLEGFVQLKDGVSYYVNIEAEINYRNNTTGQISYLKSNQSWYISGTETGASIAPGAVDNSQKSDAGGFLTGAWLANNTLRYESTGSGYRRFAVYRQSKAGTAYPATVSTKYKIRVSPVSTTVDNSVVGIVDRGNV